MPVHLVVHGGQVNISYGTGHTYRTASPFSLEPIHEPARESDADPADVEISRLPPGLREHVEAVAAGGPGFFINRNGERLAALMHRDRYLACMAAAEPGQPEEATCPTE